MAVPTPGVGTIVVGVDGTEASLAALAQTARLVRGTPSRVVAVYVRHLPSLATEPGSVEAMTALADSFGEIEAQVRSDLKTALGGTGAPFELEVRDGEPASEIMEVAHEVGAASVVIGAKVHGPVASVLLSSVAEHLLHSCDVTLVIVRPDPPPA